MATRADGTMRDSGVDAMVTQAFTIRRVITESHDTFSFELEPSTPDGEFSFKPGQFNMLYVFGVGEIPISISGDPSRPSLLVHTTREVGAVTRAMRRLKAGQAVGVRGPFGRPWPIEDAVGRDIVIVTGGIGLAPLRPVIYHVLTHRDRFDKMVILYGARSPEDILFKKELEAWRARFDFEVHLTVDRATGSWRGNVGVVTQMIGRSPFDPTHCTAMICGPEVMMRFTAMELDRRGVKEDSIYVSMERNMKCGIGFCGHCQMGGTFVCKDGPVYRYDELDGMLMKREV